METKEKITFDEFLNIESRLDVRIGKVIRAVRIPKKDKLIELTVIFGEKDGDEITVVTNLGEFKNPIDLLGYFFPFIVNLTPVKLGGVISEAMIIVGKAQLKDIEGMVELTPDDYTIGSKLI